MVRGHSRDMCPKMNTANKVIYYRDVVLALVQSDGWGPWTKCSKTCGGGWQRRDKYCNGDLCGRIKVNCNRFDCNGKCNILYYYSKMFVNEYH